MRASRAVALAGAAAAATALQLGAAAAPVARLAPNLTITANVHHDTSPPLRDLVGTGPVTVTPRFVHENGRLPLPAGPYAGDPVRQRVALPATSAVQVASFDGLGFGFPGFTVNAVPPDTVGAVGKTQYVQWVNLGFAVFDKKSGHAILGPSDGNKIWAGFGGECDKENDGDPVVNYDRFAQRWVLQQFTLTNGYNECVAVSTTPDATGPYHRYAFPYKGNNDYPKAGVWRDGYYNTYNMFSGESGAKVCALDRARMLAGRSATQQCVQLPASVTGLLPGDNDGTRLAPAGTPEPILGLGLNALTMRTFHVDWAHPSKSFLSDPSSIEVAPYKPACALVTPLPARAGTCVPQPLSGVAGQAALLGLDPLSDRPMFRLAYRRFADGHDAIVVTHTVDAMPSAAAALRWYELRRSGSSWRLAQQGTYASADMVSRWMGSAAMDKAGDIAIGYSVSSATTVFPGIRITGRRPSDPAGMLEGEKSIVEGLGEQTTAGLVSRWGDYSAMTIDPVDDCTFWYTTEYMKSAGVFAWSTKVAAYKFPTCR